MTIETANRLIKMRKAHGYSQEELAEKLGISRQAVSKWERAESSPDTDNLIMLSKLYGVSLDELLSGESEAEPEPNKEEPRRDNGKDSVHVSFLHGIDVTDEDGSKVHVGWDGIHVDDKKNGEHVHLGADDDVIDADDFTTVGEDGQPINSYINDIEVDEDGVTFTENGVRSHHSWNSNKHGKKRFVHKVRSEKTGKWRTTIISEDGHKVVVDTDRELDDSEIGDKGVKVEKSVSSGFPYAVFVTGVYLLLGFVWNLWHPGWAIFLTIPVYYAIASAVRSKKISALDIIVPVLVTGAYVALGLIYNLWHPLWLLLFIIPVYYGISFAVRRNYIKSGATTIWSILVTVAYVALGIVFGKTAWTVGWLLFFTIPMFDSIASSIRKKKGIRWIRRFPWEILIVAGYLFVGLMYGIWHPTWVAFLLIPVWRWIVNLISRGKSSDNSGSDHIDVDVDIDDDDD